MIHVDGAAGGGGVLRTALGLSLATDDPVRIENVRGSRPTPGLKAQHVACVEAARLVGSGRVEGAEEGSETVTFSPGVELEPDAADRPREHAVSVGTAGSATLVASTVLPAALTTETTVRMRIGGGTDVAWSPPADYFGGVTLPLLRTHGLAAALDVPERGFYPAGGGTLRLTFAPSTLDPLNLDGEPTVDRARVAAVASADLLDADVADRLARSAGEALADPNVADEPNATSVPVAARAARYAEAQSTGASVVVRAEGTAGDLDRPVPLAGFAALGEQGTPSAEIAAGAVEAFHAWRRDRGAVDRHLADQLVPYLALAGGRIRIPEVTDHVANAVAVADAFGLDVEIDETAAPGDGAVLRREP